MTSLHPETGVVGTAAAKLANALGRNWWLMALRGVAAIIFGFVAFGWPGLTLLSLTFVWGLFAFVDGVLAIGTALSARELEGSRRWWLGLIGVVGIIAGVVAFAYPAQTARVLLLYIGVWAIIVGALEVWGAIRLRKEIKNEWMLVLAGLVSIAFGVILFARPAAGALSVVWLIGAYAVIAGAALIGLSFRLKRVKDLGTELNRDLGRGQT
jgi:uncharacterized membrane protein HdeD (DUF308 family)